MTKRTIDCPDCGAAVPNGRLSCRDCGALLAAVTGSRSTSTPMAASAEETVVEAWAETVAQAIAVPRAVTAPVAGPRPVVPTEPEPLPVAEPEPVASDEPVPAGQLTIAAALEPAPVQTYLLPDPPETDPSPWPPVPQPAGEFAPAHEVDASGSSLLEQPDVAPPGVPYPDWTNQPILEPRPYLGATARTTSVRPGDTRSLATPAGYRPPTMALAAAGSSGAAAGTWPGASSLAEDPPEPVARKQWTRPELVLDPARASELAVWFVIVGATLGLLGFLLPWSRVVIGSGAYGDYFASWGLAGPSHVLVVLGLMAMLALAVLQTRVPVWLSGGVLGLVGGALLLGLVWPYLIGPLGADVGVLVTALGGVALIAGGILAIWASHHAEASPGV